MSTSRVLGPPIFASYFPKEFDKQGWVDKILSSNVTMSGLETLINVLEEGREGGRKGGREEERE